MNSETETIPKELVHIEQSSPVSAEIFGDTVHPSFCGAYVFGETGFAIRLHAYLDHRDRELPLHLDSYGERLCPACIAMIDALHLRPA